MVRRRALAYAVGADQTNLPVKVHGMDLHVPPAAARRTKGPVFTPPAAGIFRRHVGRLFHRRSRSLPSLLLLISRPAIPLMTPVEVKWPPRSV